MSVIFEKEVKGLDGLSRTVAGIRQGLVTDPLLDSLGTAAIARILERTASGKDIGGEPFRPYSKEWKKRRREKGRPTAVVDLRFEGRMLDDIRYSAESDRGLVRIHFSGTEEGRKAYYHNEAGAGKGKVKRRFFGLSEEDAAALEGIVTGHIERVLKGE